MRKAITYRLAATALFLVYAGLLFAQIPAWQWAQSNGGGSVSYSYGAATDNEKNMYLLVGFSGASITIGNTILANTGGGQVAALIKYNAAGQVIWARTGIGYNTGMFNGNIYVNPGGICTDRFGNVYIAGAFEGSIVVFGNDTLVNQAPIQYALFVVKYDSAGNVLWVQTGGSTDGAVASAISADGNGNTYITGYFNNVIALGGFPLHTGNSNAFTAKFDTAGNVVWANCPNYLYNAELRGTDIAADSAGNVFETGYFQNDSILFDTIPVYNPSPYGSWAGYTVKFDTGGNPLWARGAWSSNNTNTKPLSVACDNRGNAYITGTSSSYIIFGNDTLTGGGNYMQEDIFVVKYDSDGNVNWARNAQGNATGGFDGMAVPTDPSGNFYVLGANQGSVELTIDGDNISLSNTDSIGDDQYETLFIAKFDTAANIVWVTAAGEAVNTSLGAKPIAMAVDNTGAVYCAGYIESGTGYFGNYSVNAPSGYVYYYIAKLDTPDVAVTTTVSDIKNTENAVSVFPNPSSGIFTVDGVQTATRLLVTDMLGRHIIDRDLTAQIETQVNLGSPESGVYFFRFITGTGSIIKKVLVVH